MWTRRQLLRGSAGLVAAAASGGCAKAVAGTPRAAPAPRTSARRPARGPMTVAVVRGEPYAFPDKASGELTGQTVEVARAVLKTMGIDEVKFVLTEFTQMFPTLLARRADLAGGLYVSKAECRGAEWSAPDHVALTAFAVPPGNPKGLKDFADVIAAGATVAAMRGLPEQLAATRAGVPPGKLTVLSGPIEMLQAVSAGQADCAAFNDIGLRALVRTGTTKLHVTAGFTPAGAETLASAFAFPRDAKRDLIQEFSTGLTGLHESGEWLTLSEPFGFTEQNLPPDGLTVEKLCTG